MKQLSFIKRSAGNHWVGDGFPVRSIFSYHDIAQDLSPFLLLDYAGPTVFEPTDQRRGVGAHPHRGFETVTIVYAGQVAHRDSAGGGGVINAGDVQWMTAAAGVVHEEYHGPDYAREGGPFEMIQLWVNLPARDKLSSPGYQAITAAKIPRVSLPGGTGSLRVIAGEYGDIRGPAHTHTEMNLWDLRLRAGAAPRFELPAGHTTALFVLRGELHIDGHRVGPAELAVMDAQDTVLSCEAGTDSVVLLLSGEPLNEPIVGHGPFVMNTREEITQAMHDYASGRLGHLTAGN